MTTERDGGPASLRLSLRTMVVGGCLAMVYGVGIGSPATTEFLRAVGATELHFGLITGIPLVMLSMQFVGAAALNRARRRKAVFIACLVVCRLLYLGVAFLPMALPERPSLVLPTIIALLAISAATHNFAVPFWFSWMADLIPKRVLNRVWGWRQRAMHLTWTLANLLVTVLLYRVRWSPTVTFPVLTVFAVAAGIADVLLFLRVTEPANLLRKDANPLRDLMAPLVHPVFRRFVLFTCCWSFATACAANFMQLYVLKVLRVPMWQTSLIWCMQGLGVAMASGFWGRMADRHGQRPIIALSVALKPMIVVVFFLLTPTNVLWLLPLAFVPDGVLNSGTILAVNGYMLSFAPRDNRSAFIAAITGLAGVCGGVSAILAGAVLAGTADWSVELSGRTLNHYHLLFAASMVMRVLCLPLARRIREPGSARSRDLVEAFLDDWPNRVPRFPVGLYRNRRG